MRLLLLGDAPVRGGAGRAGPEGQGGGGARPNLFLCRIEERDFTYAMKM